MNAPPIIEAQTRAITILPIVERIFLSRVLEVLIVTFHFRRDPPSQNWVSCPDVLAVAIISPLPLPLLLPSLLPSCGLCLDGGTTYRHPSSERPTCWHREARRPR